MKNSGKLSANQTQEFLKTLQNRFEKNMHRHHQLDWEIIQSRLKANPDKLWSVYTMEETGGEPDVIAFDNIKDEYIWCDCSSESPKGRRSLCYDEDALEARKEHKPQNSAIGMATEMGLELLNEEQYHELQKLGTFDNKTSSWLLSPPEIRKLGGAIFGDCRYGRVFVYHNGAESYYASRGFRGILKI